ncbi:hypothetical protein Mal64_18280 [Pseudobythopirellula maris]|uniref:Uncharacterized protein n=1 Tax=Pseudobythopirellula maris TaxID=2527991 RepID=A0A5C5ZMF8_9BACT|nr:hypothetical protein [Pseudobythopirellula maris]TWT88348.1 hypothetical protein Mal64_18280 [Pseudobythopirellula maris]
MSTIARGRSLAATACTLLLLVGGPVLAQTPGETPDPAATAPGVGEQAERTLQSARDTAGAALRAVDGDPRAQELTAGLLQPIYAVAESFAFPTFYWLAFAAMAAGVVSFVLQLTLGKLVVMSRMGFSPAEIVSDLVGLVVSLVGLVLATQAAVENSSFTQSPAAVLSSAGVGTVIGLFLYVWGQRQELDAARGRTASAKTSGKQAKLASAE